jgi:maltose O-acetyltransferase
VIRSLRHTLVTSYGGAVLYFAFLVGRVPNHAFRLWVYRSLLGITIGERTSFHWRAVFYNPSGITIGAHSIIGNDSFLDGRRQIRIGDNVNIGGHVQVFTEEHDPSDPHFAVKGGPVVVEDDVYIATRATILPGVTIGRGAVVAAGAVVRRDVEPLTIVAGVPAKKVGERPDVIDYRLDYHLPFQ